MFESVEQGIRVSKSEYKARAVELREQLLAAQVRIREAQVPVILLFAGVDGAGKSESANGLNTWMDPRWILTHAYDEPIQSERERPRFWRFWRDLPPRGRIGIFLSAWYHDPLLQKVYGKVNSRELQRRLDRICDFERMLVDDGALIVKFWMHLGKEQQRQRLEAIEADSHQRWRVTKKDWQHWQMYESFVAAAERIIQATNTKEAPWTLVDGRDERTYTVQVTTKIIESIRERLAHKPVAAPKDAGRRKVPALLKGIDTTPSLPKDQYKLELAKLQSRINVMQRHARQLEIPMVLVFEGWDAAGKGGAIRRVTGSLDARSFQVFRVGAPTDEEAAHHYLWRFWRHMPRGGRVTVYDRSWYGRVLVERVEGFAADAEWHRAYDEINSFEQELVDNGVVLCKFWLHITKAEQKARFKAREEIPHKKWKLTEEDWRNREKWDEYEVAVDEMLARTSTDEAPWVVLEAEDKRFARIKTLKTVCKALEQAIRRVAPERDPFSDLW